MVGARRFKPHLPTLSDEYLGALHDLDCLSLWCDHQSSKVNGIRTKTLLEQCDLAVIRFGDKYKQWNAAFDARFCAAMGWAQTPEQVVEILKYVTTAQ